MRPSLRFALTLAAALGAAAPAVLAAQTSALVDSATKLNREGRWSDMMRLARAVESSPNLSPEDRCGVLANVVIAQTRLVLVESATSLLAVLDAQCATTAALKQASADLAPIRRELAALPKLPATGLDFSAIDQFWTIADLLSRDVEPSDAQWRAMLGTPGYRLSLMTVPTTREDLEIALRPSRRAEFDSLTKRNSDQADRLKHLVAAVAHRREMASLRDSLTRTLPVVEATRMAARYLPPGATEGHQAPLVAFAIFRNDAYSLGERGIIVDLYHVLDSPLTPLMAHEFHHSFLSFLSTMQRPISGGVDAPVVNALFSLRNEGMADLVDKPYPVAYTNDLMAQYAKRYNAVYASTPDTLRKFDSLLTVMAEDSARAAAAARRIGTLFWSNGHANGAYIARTIYETFGMDSLNAAAVNIFAFMRAFTAAEKKRGNPPPLSPTSVAFLDSLERKYRTVR